MYGPGSSYVGINAGRSNFRLNNGLAGFPSDRSKNAYSIYGGGYFNNNFGIELGYTDFKHLESDTDLDSIRDDPRYKKLLAKYKK